VDRVTYRAKTIEKFLEKIDRKRCYDDPLKRITDLAGVRVVCLYDSDLQKIEDIIRTEFKVHYKKDKREYLGIDKMGYQGMHFIVELNKKYYGPRYDDLPGFMCEIQVRTVLHDAWAIISHHLVYKSKASVPEKFRRDLNNVASTLEVAQVVFDNVRDNRDHYTEEIQQKQDNRESFLSQPVDYDTLKAYTKWEYPKFEISKKWHPRMVEDLILSKYHSLQEIDDIVKAAKPAVDAYYQQRPDLFKFGTAFLTKSLGFTDKEFREQHAFGQPTRDAFEKYKHLVRAKPKKKKG
jgi:ppGpp synthetase/RelA/SpoT-type nucleotidyltranferase